MRVKFVFASLFATVALAALGFWFWQQNTFSTGSLKLEILAPEEITMGQEITYVVRWKNNGETELENVELVFEFPEGTVLAQGGELRIIKQLDDVNSGQEGSERFVGRIFGKENELKEAKAFLTYSPKNLSASFQNETKTSSEISFVPINFELDIPSRIESGQQFTVTLNYFSNSDYPLSDLRIQLEYPAGFEFRGANPAPIGENEWDIGLLNKAEGRRITITGAIQGDVQQVKNFKATFGSWKEGRFTVMKEVTKAMEITKPRIFITQVVNSSPSYVASLGDTLHYEVFFRNPGDRILENLFLIVTLEGRAFDLQSVKAQNGRFQSGDNSIVWEAKDVPKLRFLGTGEEGKVEFWINVKDEIDTASPQETELVLKDRVLLSEATEEFTVKLNTGLTIEQKGFYQDEVFGNSGPIPPKVGEKTTYTITWQVKNRYNDIRNARVKASLPARVELTGEIFPEDAILTFDSGSREVVWEVGDVPAGSGYFETVPAQSVAFQVAFTPTSVHRGDVVDLIREVRVTGEDVFTDQVVSSSDGAIDTTLPDDDSVDEDDGEVRG